MRAQQQIVHRPPVVDRRNRQTHRIPPYMNGTFPCRFNRDERRGMIDLSFPTPDLRVFFERPYPYNDLLHPIPAHYSALTDLWSIGSLDYRRHFIPQDLMPTVHFWDLELIHHAMVGAEFE